MFKIGTPVCLIINNIKKKRQYFQKFLCEMVTMEKEFNIPPFVDNRHNKIRWNYMSRQLEKTDIYVPKY